MLFFFPKHYVLQIFNRDRNNGCHYNCCCCSYYYFCHRFSWALPKNGKECRRCFLLQILMDSISTVIFFWRGSLTLSFQLFVAIMLNIPLYFFGGVFFLFYFSHETLINRFVVRVRHQKYFSKIKSSYRHIFFHHHLIMYEFIKFEKMLKKIKWNKNSNSTRSFAKLIL